MIISHLCIYIYINIYIYICIIDSTSFWAHSDCYNQPQKQVFTCLGVFFTPFQISELALKFNVWGMSCETSHRFMNFEVSQCREMGKKCTFLNVWHVFVGKTCYTPEIYYIYCIPWKMNGWLRLSFAFGWKGLSPGVFCCSFFFWGGRRPWFMKWAP